MAKVKTVFFCTSCGYESPKWLGQCSVCKEWNTFKEEKVAKNTQKIFQDPRSPLNTKPKRLDDIKVGSIDRIISVDGEFNRVLGGGLVPGSLVLLGGQPGIGKSTLLLQTALSFDFKILYATGEESEEQIKLRSTRIEGKNDQFYIYAETNIDKILDAASDLNVRLIIIDSIQTMVDSRLDNSAGSITQIKECTAHLQKFAKQNHVPIVIIGHINKEGAIAGPKLLEHIVDVVLQFEGDQHYAYRMIRTTKNRYGSTDEIGVYSMQADGLRPIANPSELLISQTEEELSGSANCVSIEGQRPILLESQGLVTPSVFGNPQRSATGMDLRRMAMLLAVIEKRCQMPFGTSDVFLNLAGGLKSNDPSIDLGVMVSLISSFQDFPISRKCCFAGEVGLNGEVRAVSKIDQRILESSRLGMEKIYLSAYNTISLNLKELSIEVHQIKKVEDLLEEFFG